MQLTHQQKSYIKKHIKEQSLDEISTYLGINKQEILNYLGKKWDREKLKRFLATGEKPQERTNSFNLKAWLKEHWLNLFILSILIIFTYAYFLNNAFVSDDIAEIAQKPEIADFSRVLQNPTGPIRHFIYWLSVHIGGVHPFLFRLSNIIFHVLSTSLVYVALFIMYKSKRVAFIAASLFAIHPAISEAILWISGGMYAQYTFFFLLSFVLYILSEKSKKIYWLSVLTYLFSLMSHPVMPVALFIIYPLYDFCFKQNFKKKWIRVIPFLIIAIAYIFVNLGALPEREATLQTVHYQEKGIDNPLMMLPIALSSYAQLMFFPNTLTLYHSELSFGTVSFIIRAIFTLLFFASFFYGFIKQKLIFFWLSFFFISLSPTLTPFRLNWIVAERYIYLPSIGIFTLLALGLDKLIQTKKKYTKVILIIFAIIITLLAVRTFFRGIDWQNEDNLWIATGKTSPSSPNTHNNLGDVYGRQGDKERALREFQRAIELKPNYADAYHNSGNTYRELGNFDKALASYQKAAELNPKLWQSYQNIAAIYFDAKQYDLSLANIEKAIQINPKNLNLYNNLGIVYLAKGDKEKAKQTFTQVLYSDPKNQFAQTGLAEASK